MYKRQLPFILVAITFIAILGGGLFNVIFFMIISQWVQYARLVRAQVLALREREFVLAARAFGVRDLATVSYTHLDVYKRQGPCRTAPARRRIAPSTLTLRETSTYTSRA